MRSQAAPARLCTAGWGPSKCETVSWYCKKHGSLGTPWPPTKMAGVLAPPAPPACGVPQAPAQTPDPAADGSAWTSHRVWNEFLSRPLRAALGAGPAGRWAVPLAHGYFEQRPLALLGRTLQLTLVARRSRQVGRVQTRRSPTQRQGYSRR